MKILPLLLFSLLGVPAATMAATIDNELLSLSNKSSSVFSIKVIAAKDPWVEIISVWKKDGDVTDDTIADALNRFIDKAHILAEPTQSKSMLLFLSGDDITSIDIDRKSLIIGNHLLPLEDAKKIVRGAKNRIEHGAAAKP